MSQQKQEQQNINKTNNNNSQTTAHKNSNQGANQKIKMMCWNARGKVNGMKSKNTLNKNMT